MTIEVFPKEYIKKINNKDDAILYLSLLNIDGKNDWRMPTKQEFVDILEYLDANGYPTNKRYHDYFYERIQFNPKNCYVLGVRDDTQ
jgi:hypothetical protein